MREHFFVPFLIFSVPFASNFVREFFFYLPKKGCLKVKAPLKGRAPRKGSAPRNKGLPPGERVTTKM